MAARTPYPIGGTVYDTDGTTKLVNVTVRCINTTNNEYVEYTTASDGSFTCNLADDNFTTDYANGDKIQVCAYINNKSTWFRHTVDTAVGAYDKGSVYLHNTRAILHTAKLFAGIFSNQDDSDEYYVELYDVTNDRVIVPRTDVGTNNSIPFNFGFIGLKFDGGICVIRETDAANTVEVCLVVK